MRMTRKGLRKVSVFEQKPSKLVDEDVYLWADEGTSILANVQPASMTQRNEGQLLAELFGERVTNMLIMYYAGVLRLRVGMGVCVDVTEGNACDYRIVGVFPWSTHQQAAIELIPEARRG